MPALVSQRHSEYSIHLAGSHSSTKSSITVFQNMVWKGRKDIHLSGEVKYKSFHTVNSYVPYQMCMKDHWGTGYLSCNSQAALALLIISTNTGSYRLLTVREQDDKHSMTKTVEVFMCWIRGII